MKLDKSRLDGVVGFFPILIMAPLTVIIFGLICGIYLALTGYYLQGVGFIFLSLICAIGIYFSVKKENKAFLLLTFILSLFAAFALYKVLPFGADLPR